MTKEKHIRGVAPWVEEPVAEDFSTKWRVDGNLVYRLGILPNSPDFQNVDEITISMVDGKRDRSAICAAAIDMAKRLNSAKEDAGIPISFSLAEALNYYPITEKFRPLIEKLVSENEELSARVDAVKDELFDSKQAISDLEKSLGEKDEELSRYTCVYLF